MTSGKAYPGGKVLSQTVREMYGEGQTDYSLDPIILTDENLSLIHISEPTRPY
jgi:hypothetical protein